MKDHLPGEWGGALIELSLNGQSAAMAILDSSGHVMELGPYSIQAREQDGVLTGNTIRFRDLGDFTVVLDKDHLVLNGGYDFGICCDLPTHWWYENVHATVIPEPATLAMLAVGLGAVAMRRWEAA